MSYKQGKYDKYLQWTVETGSQAGLVTVSANLEYHDGTTSSAKRLEFDAATVKRVLLGAGIAVDKLVSSDPRVNNYQLDNQTGQWVWTIKQLPVVFEKTARAESTPRKSTRETVSTTPSRSRPPAKKVLKVLTNEKTTGTLEQKDTSIQEGG